MELQASDQKNIPSVSVKRWQDVAEDARRLKLPLKIQNAFPDLALSWSPTSLRDRWPSEQVHITTDLPQHGVPYAECSSKHERTVSLHNFVQMLDDGTSCYLNQVPLTNFPALDEEVDLSSLHLGRQFSVNLWLGGMTKSGLHFDNADNLFGQIYGRKRVSLVAPQFSRYLYPFADNPSKSAVNPDAPDFDAHPLFTHCEVWSTLLDPGDGLFIPCGWWHHIVAENVSISLNCWHGDKLTDFERTKLFLAGGPRIILRVFRDFVWHGLLDFPYQQRLFSPPPLGFELYKHVRTSFERRPK
ncbi:MAG: cupin-like domain-containing protein [Cyanobacteria bacterium J06650_10]